MFAGQTHVRQQLCFEHCQHVRYRLDLDHDPVVDQQIDFVCSERTPFVVRRYPELSNKRDSLFFELNTHRRLVDRLEQPWAECLVHLDCGTDDSPGEVAGICMLGGSVALWLLHLGVLPSLGTFPMKTFSAARRSHCGISGNVPRTYSNSAALS